MDLVKSAFLDYWTDIYPKEFQNVLSASINESNQVVQVTFADIFGGQAIFNIRKNSQMKSLRKLGADSVIEHLKKQADIEKLEIPKSLSLYLFEEFKICDPKSNCIFDHRNCDNIIEIAEDDGYYGFFGLIEVSRQSCIKTLKKLGAAEIVE